MLKNNLLLLADLLVTIFLLVLVENGLALTAFNVGKRMVLIMICYYLIELTFAARCFRVMWKAEHIKHCIAGMILGAVIFVLGIYSLITDGSWMSSAFISAMIFSIAIFLGMLLNLKKKNY